MIPVEKKVSCKSAGNYRPICLTSVVGNVLKIIITDVIVDLLKKRNLIIDLQHWFFGKNDHFTLNKKWLRVY